VVLDNEAQTVANTFGVTSVPFTVFVDANGVVLGRLSGAIPMSDLLNIAEQLFG
jgi:thioredoxin-related protein